MPGFFREVHEAANCHRSGQVPRPDPQPNIEGRFTFNLTRPAGVFDIRDDEAARCGP